ncbi:5-methyltetrahydropteroyltriglutamate-homocysteine S-methyltransferase [Chlamydoabsidia padenii]|nr:5-methyltetrahydropteroyltriglutamate-homocysteine S-methyltransferase [Chlamydoabsidia padenii]
MVVASNLGFPVIGSQRELKKLVESFWSGKIDEQALHDGCSKIQQAHWILQQEKGLQHIPSGEFTLYDRVLDTAQQFGAIPKRYQNISHPLDQFFAMGRGLQRAASEQTDKVDVPAMEMKKWFDTNYHFIVPEFEQDQSFQLERAPRVVEQFKAAKVLNIHTRPVLVGPVSFLFLGKAAKGVEDFDTLSLLPKLLPLYVQVLEQLKEAGADWVQIDEPILILDLEAGVKLALEKAYKTIQTQLAGTLKVLVAAYFGRVESNIYAIKDFVDAIHLDLVRAPEELDTVLPLLNKNQVLSMGVVDGRNIWINDLENSIALVQKAVAALGQDRVFVSPSCSLAHSPYSTSFEVKIKEKNPELYSWLSFSVEKCAEVVTIAQAVNGQDVKAELESNAAAIKTRRTSPQTTNPAVRDRVAKIPAEAWKRSSPFATRREAQVKKLKLPLFPATTNGSYPQTKDIRVARQQYKKGTLSQTDYDTFIKAQIKDVVEFQEQLDLDVLVHGEPERNDMVEHFGNLMHGYDFTENGWVVSYGSRCVKPPVIFGDVSRRGPMTINEIVYAQSLTKRPMKGMLTGPVTMMKWSFVRDDIPANELCAQVSLALRDEVVDLESAGIPCIQVDEPAIREGLPIRRTDWDAYLDWSVGCFRLSTSGVRDETQIHTHMCYSDFNEIFDAIAALDADVITIENSKSDEKLLKIFETKQYTNEIGPGIYDIHSPRVPSVEEMKQRFGDMLKYIPAHLLWVNPDCGLKSRQWPETKAALTNMVEVAKYFRAQHKA